MSVALLLLLSQEWPTYHGGYSLEGVADAAPPDAPALLWRFKAGNRVETTPVCSGGRIFVVNVKGGLFAIDAKGKDLWKVENPKDAFLTPAIVADGKVVLGTLNGRLRAYDAATGKDAWDYDVAGNLQGSPNRVELPGGKKGVVAVSQSDGSLHAVDLESGKGAWKAPPIDRCDGSPGVGGGRVVLGSCASALHVVLVDRSEGRIDIPLGGDSQVAGGVAVADGIAYAGTRNGKLVAVDLAAEKILWTNEDAKKESFATPAVNRTLVVTTSDDGKVYALRRDTGGRAWDYDTGARPFSPVIAGNRVVVTSGGTLLLLDLETGKKIWSEKVADELTSPAVAGGLILVGADDGTVVAFGRKP